MSLNLKGKRKKCSFLLSGDVTKHSVEWGRSKHTKQQCKFLKHIQTKNVLISPTEAKQNAEKYCQSERKMIFYSQFICLLEDRGNTKIVIKIS